MNSAGASRARYTNTKALTGQERQRDLEEEPRRLARHADDPRVGAADDGAQVRDQDARGPRRVRRAARGGTGPALAVGAVTLMRRRLDRFGRSSWSVGKASSSGGRSMSSPVAVGPPCPLPCRRRRGRRLDLLEAAADELDEDVLERRLRLGQRRRCAAPRPATAETTPPRAESSASVSFTATVWRSDRASPSAARGGDRGQHARAAAPSAAGHRDRAGRARGGRSTRSARGASAPPACRWPGSAAVHDGDPVAQLVDLGHVVGREQQRAARARRPSSQHELAHVAGRRDVEAERRLVEEEDPRIVEQAAREVQLLALPGRERRDLLVRAAPRARRSRSARRRAASPRARGGRRTG